VRHRLGELPRGVREALSAAAVLGRRVDLDVLEAYWQRDLAQLDDAVHAALAAGLIETDKEDRIRSPTPGPRRRVRRPPANLPSTDARSGSGDNRALPPPAPPTSTPRRWPSTIGSPARPRPCATSRPSLIPARSPRRSPLCWPIPRTWGPPRGQPRTDAGGPLRLHRAVVRWLSAVQSAPVAVLLDDLHRAAVEALALTRSLLEVWPASGTPQLLVATYRSEEARSTRRVRRRPRGP
jgi:hypothetical protein